MCQPEGVFAHHGKRRLHRLHWVQEARPCLERHRLGDVHFVESLIALPQRKPNIEIVVFNGFDLNRQLRFLLNLYSPMGFTPYF